MTSFEQFVQDTNRAATGDEVFTLFAHSLAQLGYDKICYSLLTDHPSLGLKAGHGVLRNYPEEWMTHYTINNYYDIDPVLPLCFKTNKPFKWDWMMQNTPQSEAAKKLMFEAEEAHLYDGLGVPIHGINSELAGVGMASSTKNTDLSRADAGLIRALCFQFHIAFNEKETEGERLKHIVLTPREKEILLWAAEGKSDQVISDILSLSYATVRFHMNNIFKKLEVNERTLAVVKAIRHGLIFPEKLI